MISKENRFRQFLSGNLSMNNEKIVETLTQLGLTVNEARTYLALLQQGIATARQLCKISNIARPDIYRITSTLQKEGLIEKMVTRPAGFQAVPARQVLSILLNRKTLEQNDLKKKTKELLGDLKKNLPERKVEPDSEVVIIPGKEVILQKLRDRLLKAQHSVHVVTSPNRFSLAILEFAPTYRKALRKGLKIKLTTTLHEADENALKIIQKLSKNPNFEVRYFSDSSPVILTIFDFNEIFVTMSATAQNFGAPALWSNNLSLIKLAENYFETKWQNATNTMLISAEEILETKE